MSPRESSANSRLILLSAGALFTGPVVDNGIHRHLAMQFVVSPEPFVLTLPGREIQTRCAWIPSRTEHSLYGTSPHQTVLLLDPESVHGEAWLQQIQDNGQAPPEPLVREIKAQDCPLLNSGSDSGEEFCAAVAEHIDRVCAVVGGRAVAAPAASSRAPRITRACAYIAQRLDEQPSLEEIAAHIQLSPGRLTHLFKQEVGVPIRRYALWLRTRQAVQSLIDHPTNLTQAAHEANFADQAHFSRTFREMFGLTPKQVLTTGPKRSLHICFG